MSPVPKPSPEPPRTGPLSDPLVKQALEWTVHLHSGDETEADRAAFESWKAISGRHATAAGQAEALWASLRPALRRYRGAGRRMASMVLVLAIGMALAAISIFRLPSYAEIFADYKTATGEIRSVTLADGSIVELDTGTSFDLGDRRTLKLHSGQVFVRVAPDPSRPFRVVTSRAETMALGTAFSVRIGGASDQIAVTEHAVRVTEDATGRSTDLREGEVLEVGPTNSAKTSKADLDALLAWRNGGLHFHDAPFGSVVAEVERYRRGRIVVPDEEIRGLPVTGNFDIGNTDAFLDAAAVSLPVRVVRLPGFVLIRRDSSRSLPAR